MDTDQVSHHTMLLPILCGASSSRGLALLDLLDFTGLCHELIPGKVYVLFAMTGLTPHGTIGTEWLASGMHKRLGQPPLDEVFEAAAANLAPGLELSSYRVGEREQLFELTRAGYLGASALALPGFHEQMVDVVGAQRLIVGVPCGDNLFFADADSPLAAAKVRELTLGSEHTDQYLGPSVFLVERSGITLVADRRI